jgi:hypothetical protein
LVLMGEYGAVVMWPFIRPDAVGLSSRFARPSTVETSPAA